MDIATVIAVALPWLFILACPLAMWWMMRGMNCDKQQSGADSPNAATNMSEEVRRLEDRIAQLEADRANVRRWS